MGMSVAAALVAMLFWIAPTAYAVDMPTFGKRFCKGDPVQDYEAILDRMPSVRHPPASEQLPFGPRNLSLYQSAISRVIVGRGGFGYGFFDDTYGVREEVHLYWDVTTTLSRITRNGSVIRTIDSENQYLGVVKKIGDRSFWLDVPPGPAFYRFDIEFRDHRSGEMLGSYSEYLRVVKPRFRARLTVNRTSFRPGESAYARIENPGTIWAEFGVPYAVQRLDGADWTRAPGAPQGPWIMPLLFMGSGGTGSCMRYQIPTDAEVGRYRFVKGIAPMGGKGRGYFTEFDVIP